MNTSFPLMMMVLSLLIFLFLVFMVGILNQKEKRPSKERTPKVIQKERHDEVIDTLDFLLQNQIITPTEYNNLVVKSLPYLN